VQSRRQRYKKLLQSNKKNVITDEVDSIQRNKTAPLELSRYAKKRHNCTINKYNAMKLLSYNSTGKYTDCKHQARITIHHHVVLLWECKEGVSNDLEIIRV